jgi:uncharacterized Zn finger protein (UPF0148 family)
MPIIHITKNGKVYCPKCKEYRKIKIDYNEEAIRNHIQISSEEWAKRKLLLECGHEIMGGSDPNTILEI